MTSLWRSLPKVNALSTRPNDSGLTARTFAGQSPATSIGYQYPAGSPLSVGLPTTFLNAATIGTFKLMLLGGIGFMNYCRAPRRECVCAVPRTRTVSDKETSPCAAHRAQRFGFKWVEAFLVTLAASSWRMQPPRHAVDSREPPA